MNEEEPKTEAAGITLASIKSGADIISKVIEAVGDDSNVKDAKRNLGRTLATVTKSINVILLPLAAMNFAYDRAEKYFTGGDFEKDVIRKTSSIPEADVTEPKPSVVGPAMQGLTYSLGEPDLREMYLNLIGKSMDGRVPNAAHPAFVELIKQISTGEAKVLSKVLSVEVIPVAQIKLNGERGAGDGVFSLLYTNLVPPSFMPEGELDSCAFVDNWIRLGLVEVTWGHKLNTPEAYKWSEDHSIVSNKRFFETASRKLEIGHGVMQRTSFGLKFADAVGILKSVIVLRPRVP